MSKDMNWVDDFITFVCLFLEVALLISMVTCFVRNQYTIAPTLGLMAIYMRLNRESIINKDKGK